jgi:haloacetate dehalogenase
MFSSVDAGRIPEFDYDRLTIGDASYLVARAGQGPAVVLLHGYPQTHYCWRRVAPALAASHTVIAPDLRGYGETRAPRGDPDGAGYSKREMAADLVSILDALGVERAAVVGHDRGGRVAYRMALDAPDRVERLAVLNVIPTLEQFERVTPENALEYWPFFFLAQPPPFPERLIAAATDHYVRSILRSWANRPDAIDSDAVAHYVASFDEDTIETTCADYRAAFHLDREHDAADRSGGRRIACPMLVLWGALDAGLTGSDQGARDADDGPLEVWRRWADDVDGRPIAAGHFIPEEAPDELLAALGAFI